MPLVPYVVVLLLSCGLRLATGLGDTHGGAIDALFDVAPSWLVRAAIGLVLGVVVGVVASTLLARASSAAVMRTLGAELARGLPGRAPGLLVLTAILGGAAEEVFFRGIVQPWLGVWLSALAFGVVHVRLRGTWWLWPVLSIAFGLVASLTLQATGTLLAPIAMHVVVNLAAQRRLEKMHPAREKRALGGLLRVNEASERAPHRAPHTLRS